VFGLRVGDLDFLRKQVPGEQQVKLVRSQLVIAARSATGPGRFRCPTPSPSSWRSTCAATPFRR